MRPQFSNFPFTYWWLHMHVPTTQHKEDSHTTSNNNNEPLGTELDFLTSFLTIFVSWQFGLCLDASMTATPNKVILCCYLSAIDPSTYQCLFTCLPACYPSVWVSVWVPVCLSVCQSECLSVWVSVWVSACWSVCLSTIHFPVYPHVCLHILLNTCRNTASKMMSALFISQSVVRQK